MILDIRKRILLGAGLVLLFLILIYFLLAHKTKAPAPAPAPTTDQTETVEKPAPSNEVIVNTPPPPPPASPEEREKLFTIQLAKIFVERYLSSSNQNQNSHITDIKDLVTDQMMAYIETQKVEFDSHYKGTSTKVISSSLDSFDGAKASVKIGIQQYLEEKGESPKTAYKNGTVSLVKEDGKWKVNGLYLSPQ